MSPENRINWQEELGGELRDHSFFYMVKKDSGEVKTLVTAAVYRTLAGHEIRDRGTQKFMEDSSISQKEELEIAARDLMEGVRWLASERHGYQHEWDEARHQGEKAATAVKEGRTFMASYDYWALRPIKALVNLFPVPEFPDYYLFSTSLAGIGDIQGVPYNLLSRDCTAKEIQSGKLAESPIDFFKKIAEKMGIDLRVAMQEVLDSSQEMLFVNIARVTDSGVGGHPSLTAQQQFEMLSEREKELVQEPRQERLHGLLQRNFVVGTGKATLTIDIWTRGNVYFNPLTNKIGGELLPNDHDAVYARLRPQRIPDVVHADILEIRRQAQAFVKELGFPEPPKSLFR